MLILVLSFYFSFQTDASARIDFNKEKGFLAIYDKTGKLRIVYASPILRLPSNKTASAPLDWDASSSSIHVALPEAALSFPLVLVFGLSVKLPEHGHDWFRFSFPSIKLPKPGFEISDSESDDDNDESKQKSKGGFGFGIKAPKFGGSTEVDTSATLKVLSRTRTIHPTNAWLSQDTNEVNSLIYLNLHSSSPSSSWDPNGLSLYTVVLAFHWWSSRMVAPQFIYTRP